MKMINLFSQALINRLLVLITCSFSSIHVIAQENTRMQALELPAARAQEREYSYTNKLSAFYYGKSQCDTFRNWFAGWNINGRKIFSDYQLSTNAGPLVRKQSYERIRPDLVLRQWNVAEERFYLADHRNVLIIQLSGKDTLQEWGLHLNLAHGQLMKHGQSLVYELTEQKGWLAITGIGRFYPQARLQTLFVPAKAKGFALAWGDSYQEAAYLAGFASDSAQTWLEQRQQRLSKFAGATQTASNLPDLNKALSWLQLTLDQLVTEQQGKGIYAGLPWFTQYWGRDQFISLPGTCLVNGQFELAREILLNFARFQQTDSSSKDWGRIPNRATPEEIIYNTADGTPRFVSQIWEYVRYSGDTGIVNALYPTVLNSLNGTIRYRIDRLGFLCHEDADTWMDAKKDGKIPWSPRGNRANDIQALWVSQLEATAQLAQIKKDLSIARFCDSLAKQVRINFNRFFLQPNGTMADRLKTDGKADYSFRPNQLYALDLIPQIRLRRKISQDVWTKLVYPWGVASLNQEDDNFHPYHENWHFYHKDAAYHNGTVWLWNNGMAMQRAIEYGQVHTAWRLFQNMNEQALKQAAFGSLAENADALPMKGYKWSKSTGTFLQAWSNAEQLRVWYTHFCGFRPRLNQAAIVWEPRFPDSITQVNQLVWAEGKSFEMQYQRAADMTLYQLHAQKDGSSIHFHTTATGSLKLQLPKQGIFKLELKGGNWKAMVFSPNKGMETIGSGKIKKEQAEQIWPFVKPKLKPGLKSLSNYHPKPIQY